MWHERARETNAHTSSSMALGHWPFVCERGGWERKEEREVEGGQGDGERIKMREGGDREKGGRRGHHGRPTIKVFRE